MKRTKQPSLVISCSARRYSCEIWGAIQPRVLSQAACLKLGGDVCLHDWSVCKSLYTLCTHFEYFEQKGVYKMLKSVTKVCNSYFVHTFGVLFKEVLPKFKTWTISVYKGVISVYKVLKSVCKVVIRTLVTLGAHIFPKASKSAL